MKNDNLKLLLSPNYIIHWFFGILFVSILIFIVVFAKDTKAILLKQQQMPLIELEDFSIYEANKDGVMTNIMGSKALQYPEYEISFDTTLTQIQPQKNNQSSYIEYIYGEKIIRKEHIYEFPNGGTYTRDDGRTFWSAGGSYNMNDAVFNGIGAFWLSDVESLTEGENIVFHQKTEQISAQNVRATFDLERARSSKKQQTQTKNKSKTNNAEQH